MHFFGFKLIRNKSTIFNEILSDMKKKILIGVGVLVVLIIVGFFFLNNRNRTLSPPGDASISNDGLNMSVTYSRPSVRGRLIFGEEAEGALQPYGVYWRLGANEPTDIEVDQDFLFAGKEVAAGKYNLYAVPRKGEMEIRLNSELRFWGYTEASSETDLVTTVVRVEPSSPTEQFTIDLEAIEGGANLVFSWDTYKWTVPVLKQ